jgi:hypothetical protein
MCKELFVYSFCRFLAARSCVSSMAAQRKIVTEEDEQKKLDDERKRLAFAKGQLKPSKVEMVREELAALSDPVTPAAAARSPAADEELPDWYANALGTCCVDIASFYALHAFFFNKRLKRTIAVAEISLDLYHLFCQFSFDIYQYSTLTLSTQSCFRRTVFPCAYRVSLQRNRIRIG